MEKNKNINISYTPD